MGSVPLPGKWAGATDEPPCDIGEESSWQWCVGVFPNLPFNIALKPFG